eukprot:6189042-Pleurochrysis_carterae.AAC.1
MMIIIIAPRRGAPARCPCFGNKAAFSFSTCAPGKGAKKPYEPPLLGGVGSRGPAATAGLWRRRSGAATTASAVQALAQAQYEKVEKVIPCPTNRRVFRSAARSFPL